MTRKLYNWLQRDFYLCNHFKYHHLFDIWICNSNKDQIEGFSKQMYNKENKVLG